MATTTNRSLRYPLATAAPNIPQDFQNLATDVDAALAVGGAITCTSSTRPSTPASGVLIWESDTGHTLRFNSSSNGWRYLGNRVITPSATARNSLVAYQGLLAFQQDTSVVWQFDGTAWQPTQLGTTPIFGKAWGTSGFHNLGAVNTPTPVAFDTAGVSGGFTFSSLTGMLTVPYDGLYSIQNRGYVSGGSATGLYAWDVRRVRSGVGDVAFGAFVGNKLDALDRVDWHGDPNVGLKAGDQLQSRVSYDGGGNGGQLSYFMSNAAYGASMTVTYLAPLNGATPI